MNKHAVTTVDEIKRSFLRPILSIKMRAPTDPNSWKTPVIIDAVIGCTDDPDILKSFAVNCMMAPAPDIRWMMAKASDKMIPFVKICL